MTQRTRSSRNCVGSGADDRRGADMRAVASFVYTPFDSCHTVALHLSFPLNPPPAYISVFSPSSFSSLYLIYPVLFLLEN